MQTETWKYYGPDGGLLRVETHAAHDQAALDYAYCRSLDLGLFLPGVRVERVPYNHKGDE